MAGALHKAMVYLGFTEEVERYDEDYDDELDAREVERRDDRQGGAAAGGRDDERSSRLRDASSDASERRGDSYRSGGVDEPTPIRRPVALATAPALNDDDSIEPRHAAVTPLPRRVPVAEVVNDVEVTGVHRITTIHPRTYNEAKKVGEAFREGTPVIMNLSDLDDADAKRLVDFAAGLVFGLAGSIERVTNKVFLLSPANVEVTSSDNAGPGAARSGLFNQS